MSQGQKKARKTRLFNKLNRLCQKKFTFKTDEDDDNSKVKLSFFDMFPYWKEAILELNNKQSQKSYKELHDIFGWLESIISVEGCEEELYNLYWISPLGNNDFPNARGAEGMWDVFNEVSSQMKVGYEFTWGW